MGFVRTRRIVHYVVVTVTTLVAWFAVTSSAFVSPALTASRCISRPGFLLFNNNNNNNNNNNETAAASSWERRWDEKYQALQELLLETPGTETVDATKHPQLASWLAIQRENLRRGVMKKDRREKLAALGIGTSTAIAGSLDDDDDGDPDTTILPDEKEEALVVGPTTEKKSSWEQRWEDSYAALVLFRETFGHTRVSPRDDEKLANWVRIQRENLRRGAMKQDRRERLSKLLGSDDVTSSTYP